MSAEEPNLMQTAMLNREKLFREQLERIGQQIGYGRAQQILAELWDAMLHESYGIPPGRGALGATIDDALPPIPKSLAKRRSMRSHGGYEMVPAYSIPELKAFAHAAIDRARAQLTASEASRKELREALIAMVEHFERVDAKGESARVVQRGIAALANDAEQKGGGANG